MVNALFGLSKFGYASSTLPPNTHTLTKITSMKLMLNAYCLLSYCSFTPSWNTGNRTYTHRDIFSTKDASSPWVSIFLKQIQSKLVKCTNLWSQGLPLTFGGYPLTQYICEVDQPFPAILIGLLKRLNVKQSPQIQKVTMKVTSNLLE